MLGLLLQPAAVPPLTSMAQRWPSEAPSKGNGGKAASSMARSDTLETEGGKATAGTGATTLIFSLI